MEISSVSNAYSTRGAMKQLTLAAVGPSPLKHCVGLDVSVKETTICIVDETGKIVAPHRRGLRHPVWAGRYFSIEAAGSVHEDSPDEGGY
jgi:hypothetical protein